MLLKANLSEGSQKMHESTLVALKHFNPSEVKKLINEVFREIDRQNITEWKNVSKIDFRDIQSLIYDLDINDKVKVYYIEMFKMLMR